MEPPTTFSIETKKSNSGGAAGQTSKRPKLRTESLRVRRETKKRIQAELATLNRKDFGRKITADDFLSVAIGLVQTIHLDEIKARSLSNRDRLEMMYKEHCEKHGKVTKDEFLGILLESEGRKERK